jgi:3-hydroxyisobutyrate dehydrogenase-like beta-hydroxyacid dehydrogenase
MHVAVIAPGSMGAAVAHRLAAAGVEVAVTLEGRSATSVARAAGLRRLPDEASLAAWADVVLSIVPPAEAGALAERLAPVLVPRGGDVVFADCNAVSPTTVRAIAASLPGVAFADVALLGAPPDPTGPGPRLWAAGPGAARLARSVGGPLDLRVIDGGEIGAGSALKMACAGLNKGFATLGAAIALSAEACGAAPALFAEFEESHPALLQDLRAIMPGVPSRAHRWIAEMREIAAWMGDDPFAAAFLAAARHYEAMAADLDDPRPDGITARLAALFPAP